MCTPGCFHSNQCMSFKLQISWCKKVEKARATEPSYRLPNSPNLWSSSIVWLSKGCILKDRHFNGVLVLPREIHRGRLSIWKHFVYPGAYLVVHISVINFSQLLVRNRGERGRKWEEGKSTPRAKGWGGIGWAGEAGEKARRWRKQRGIRRWAEKEKGMERERAQETGGIKKREGKRRERPSKGKKYKENYRPHQKEV